MSILELGLIFWGFLGGGFVFCFLFSFKVLFLPHEVWILRPFFLFNVSADAVSLLSH